MDMTLSDSDITPTKAKSNPYLSPVMTYDPGFYRFCFDTTMGKLIWSDLVTSDH